MAQSKEDKFMDLAYKWVTIYGNEFKLQKYLLCESLDASYYRAKPSLTCGLVKFLGDNHMQQTSGNLFTFLEAIDGIG